MRRQISTSIIVLMALMVCSCAPKMKEQEPVVRKVKVATPLKSETVSERSFSGVIKENEVLNLAFRVGGPIQKIYVKEGDFVRKGQLIAEMDPRDYEIQATVAKAQYEQMKSEYDRLTELNSRKSVADNDYEKAVAGEKMLAAQLKHANDQLNDTKLYAPYSGYIQEVKYHERELVNTGMAVATLLDVHTYSIDIDLPLAYYIQKENFVSYSCQQPQVSDSLYSIQLSGCQVKANNNQLYTLTFKLDPKTNKKLVPGMNVLVKINYQNGIINPLSVPLQAVFNQEGKAYVWVYNSSSSIVQRREVTTDGLVGNGEIRIVSGLEETDQVVVAGVNSLHENEEVRLMESTSETNIGGLL